jgi:hypothetical protein
MGNRDEFSDIIRKVVAACAGRHYSLTGCELICERAAVSDRHGGVQQRSLLGEDAEGVRACGQANGTPVHEAVSRDRQERCPRCGGDLQRHHATQHAFCADQGC